MENYERAYQLYSEKCDQFVIDKMDLIQFIKSITDEQVNMMLQELELKSN
jgi:hypothetical protein